MTPKRSLVSLKSKLIAYYSILLFAVLLGIVLANIAITTAIVKENTQAGVAANSREIREYIDKKMKQLEYFSRTMPYELAAQRALKEIARADDVFGMEAYNLRKQLDGSIGMYDFSGYSISSIHIYFSDERLYTFKSNVGKPQTAEDLAAYTIFDNRRWSLDGADGGGATGIRFERIIFDTETLERIGLLQVKMSSAAVTTIMSQYAVAGRRQIYLADRDNRIIDAGGQSVEAGELHDYLVKNRDLLNADSVDEARLDGRDVMVLSDIVPTTGWRLISVVRMDYLLEPVISSQIVLVLIGLAGLVTSLALSIIISSSITRPINRIVAAMKEVGRGNLGVSIHDSSTLETHVLSSGFENMRLNLNEHIRRELDLKVTEVEAEFAILQAQINPHFLFNTLETLNSRLLAEGSYDMSDFVANLGDLLRYSIVRGSSVVDLSTELDHVDKYLRIQKTRFGEKLDYSITVSGRAGRCRILKFIIQPIVENAVVHGIEMRPEGGAVRVTCAVTGEDILRITVRDTGIGMDQGKAAQLLQGGGAPEGKGHMKLGIQNVVKRIKLFYGEAYGLDIQSLPGEGTTMTIRIPAGEHRRSDAL